MRLPAINLYYCKKHTTLIPSRLSPNTQTQKQPQVGVVLKGLTSEWHLLTLTATLNGFASVLRYHTRGSKYTIRYQRRAATFFAVGASYAVRSAQGRWGGAKPAPVRHAISPSQTTDHRSDTLHTLFDKFATFKSRCRLHRLWQAKPQRPSDLSAVLALQQ